MNEKFTITYTGTISKSYRIENFIKALAKLPDKIKEQIIIRFVGNVPEDIIALFHQNGLASQLEIIGYVPHREALNFMSGASILLMAIPDVPDNKVIITGKLFEYLAAKRPILVIGPKDSEVEKILQDTAAGILIDYDDFDKIEKQIIEYFMLYSINKLSICPKGTEIFSRRNLTEKLAEILGSANHS